MGGGERREGGWRGEDGSTRLYDNEQRKLEYAFLE